MDTVANSISEHTSNSDLDPGEEVLWSGRSGVVAALPVVVIDFLIATFFAVFGPLTAHLIEMLPTFPHSAQITWAMYGVAVGLPAIHGVYRLIRVATLTFRFTNKRILMERGLYFRRGGEVKMYRLLDSEWEIPIHMRILGRGTIKAWTIDPSEPTFFIPAIKRPKQVRRLLMDIAEKQRRVNNVRVVES